MTIRKPVFKSDSSTDQSLGSTGSSRPHKSLLSIPVSTRHRSKSVDRNQQFLALHARYIEDSGQDKTKIRTDPKNKFDKKPRRIKRSNAFYLNRSAHPDDEQRRSYSAASDDSSRHSVCNSVADWMSQSSADTEGSCESLDVHHGRRKAKMNSVLLLEKRELLLNLKRKMKKKTPKYRGTCDLIQMKVLRNLESDQVDEYRSTLLRSRVAHQSFEGNRKHYLCCNSCGGRIVEGDLVICSNELPPRHIWHPGCFTCFTCKEGMVDLVYHPHEGHKYCDKHKPYLSKMCSYCMEKIDGERFTKANGRYYHPEHFQCWQCGKVLSGERYYGCGVYPTCIECYNTHLAKSCRSCKGPIQIDTPFYTLGLKRWHATPTCFRCCSCKTSLVGGKLVTTRGELFCNKHCYNELVCGRSSYSSCTTNTRPFKELALARSSF